MTDVTPPGDPLDAAVTSPLALTVTLALVNVPTLLLTVASVEALPTEVTSPVKLALVVTLPAVNPAAVPVRPVPAPVNCVLAVMVVPVIAAAVVAPTVAPLTVPPVIATVLAFCSAIVPTPDKVWLAFHAAAPVALNEPSAGVEWLTTTVMPRI